MGVFEMVVFVTLIACATGVATEYLKTKRKTAATMGEGHVDDLLDRIDDLEERMRIMEKIVTDDRFDLSRQIDELGNSKS